MPNPSKRGTGQLAQITSEAARNIAASDRYFFAEIAGLITVPIFQFRRISDTSGDSQSLAALDLAPRTGIWQKVKSYWRRGEISSLLRMIVRR